MKCYLEAEAAQLQLATIRYRKLRNAVLHPELLDAPCFVSMLRTPASPAAIDAVVDMLPDPEPGLPLPVKQA